MFLILSSANDYDPSGNLNSSTDKPSTCRAVVHVPSHAGRSLFSHQNGVFAINSYSSICRRTNLVVSNPFRQSPLLKSPAAISFSTCCRSSRVPEGANSPPHIGSAYTTIAADAIARLQMSMVRKLLLLQRPTAEAQENTVIQFQCLYNSLERYRAYDKFICTTDPRHEGIVVEFYSRVFNNGDIYRADYEGLYCISHEEDKDEK